jgi:hypothetical protein
MSQNKTYVVLQNDNTSNRNEAYTYFKFPSLRDTNKCKEINEYSLVFSTVEQLVRHYSEEELISIMDATYKKDVKEPLPKESLNTIRKTGTHGTFFNFVDLVARNYKPPSEEKPMKEKTIIHIDQFNNKTQKHEASKSPIKKSQYNPDAKILSINGESGVYVNPYRDNSNRWHNFEAMIACATVGEALVAMKKLVPGGNSVDIKLALQKGVIELEEPSDGK